MRPPSPQEVIYSEALDLKGRGERLDSLPTDMFGDAWQWTADCGRKGYDSASADGSAWLAGRAEAILPAGGGRVQPFG